MTADSTVTLAPMTIDDIADVMPHEVPMFGSEAWTAHSYRDELLDRKYRYYLTGRDADGVLLGWAGLYVLYETAQVLTVGVIPEARRRGIASTLLAALYAEARRRNATEILLEVRIDNDGARALYEREGFAVIGTRRGYYDNGRIDAITMRKELTA